MGTDTTLIYTHFARASVMGDRRIDQVIYTYFGLYIVMRARTGVKVSIQIPRRPVTHRRVIEVVRFMADAVSALSKVRSGR